MDFTKKEKQVIIAVLSSIMKADGIVAPNEQTFMNHAYRKLGISMNDLEDIAELDTVQCKEIFQAFPQEKKDYVSKCFLDMVGIDGKVDLRELRILHGLL